MVKRIKNNHKNKTTKEKTQKQTNYKPNQNKYNNFDVSIKTILLILVKSPGLNDILNLDIDTTKIKILPDSLTNPTELRADCIFTDDKNLFLFEIQAQNDIDFARRNLLYLANAHYKYNLPIVQVLIYVGSKKLNMASSIKMAKLDYSFTIVDLSKLNSSLFLSQEDIIVKLLSVLTRNGTQADSLKSLLTAIDQVDDMAVKYEAMELLKTLCNLRKDSIFKVKDIIEGNSMSIYIDPKTTDFYEIGYNECKEDMYSKVIPKALAESEAKTRAETKAKTRAETKAETKAEVLNTLLKLKFGHVDKAYLLKIKSASIKELNKYLKRVIKADSIDEIFV